MLKPYKVNTYVSVNDGPKYEIWSVGYGLTEDELPRVVELSYTFQEALTKKLLTPCVTTGITFFRKRPYVRIEYSWCQSDDYYNFDHITIERRYEPWTKATLKDIHDYTPADQFIQYLKERGITTCPMNF
jgi:hypothetical protein